MMKQRMKQELNPYPPENARIALAPDPHRHIPTLQVE
uniref:Uncharacterized protein n=1 Tax=Picea glauca TaxID=3330 RepID=A0A117NGA0_PICGL|nr:hypothetical protein ABT39_MTgene1531 [Picea glauca]